MLLPRKGFAGVNEELQCLLKSDLFDAEQQDEIRLLQTYWRNNGERLFSGQSIGSGVVERACKNLVGRRLKQTGACWRQGQAEKMTVLCAALYSHQWKYAWKSP